MSCMGWLHGWVRQHIKQDGLRETVTKGGIADDRIVQKTVWALVLVTADTRGVMSG